VNLQQTFIVAVPCIFFTARGYTTKPADETTVRNHPAFLSCCESFVVSALLHCFVAAKKTGADSLLRNVCTATAITFTFPGNAALLFISIKSLNRTR
jgi:hypothetical protein